MVAKRIGAKGYRRIDNAKVCGFNNRNTVVETRVFLIPHYSVGFSVCEQILKVKRHRIPTTAVHKDRAVSLQCPGYDPSIRVLYGIGCDVNHGHTTVFRIFRHRFAGDEWILCVGDIVSKHIWIPKVFIVGKSVYVCIVVRIIGMIVIFRDLLLCSWIKLANDVHG
ncbi:MAG: hypothetical protein HW390_2556 [Candidatus Brocadiaceae bacterium]|nr:hypothetical protein [Candidatus Brocadiaceae bacterium]